MTVPRDCVPILEAASLWGMAEWASERPIRHGWRGRTCRDLWNTAPRGDWLLGYAEVAVVDRRRWARAAAACITPSLDHDQAGERRALRAWAAVERWAARPSERNRRKMQTAALAVMDGMTTPTARSAADVALSVSSAEPMPMEDVLHDVYSILCSGPVNPLFTHRECADSIRRIIPFVELPGAGP